MARRIKSARASMRATTKPRAHGARRSGEGEWLCGASVASGASPCSIRSARSFICACLPAIAPAAAAIPRAPGRTETARATSPRAAASAAASCRASACAVSLIGALCSPSGACSVSLRSSSCTPCACRRCNRSSCRNARRPSPSSASMERPSPRAVKWAASRFPSVRCRLICRRPSSRSKTAASARISASIRSG
jgi:hypothetical protein